MRRARERRARNDVLGVALMRRTCHESCRAPDCFLACQSSFWCSTRMHVLVATHYWHPHRGGIEVVAHQQAIRLVRRGHRVTALTSRAGNEPAEGGAAGWGTVRA